MTWTAETSRGFESDKIAPFIVPYVQSVDGGAIPRWLDIGCGMRKVWPSAIGIDTGHHFGQQSAADMNMDGTDLSMFADQSMDAVFSSHFLEHIKRDNVQYVLSEWLRVIRIGGHLVLYVPSANLYPRMGEDGANRDHKWDIETGDVEAILHKIASENDGTWGLRLRENEERGEVNEYSFFIVVQKLKRSAESSPRWIDNIWQRHPGGAQRALVIRYGGIGDAIIAASIFPGLKKAGYHVTVNCKQDTQQFLLHDPHIDEWMIQARDFVPNFQLGPYWESLKPRYDLIINLCESVEGTLLTLPDRLTHQYPDEARRRLYGGVNYLERTHDIAGLPHDFAPAFYESEYEKTWAFGAVSDLTRGDYAPVIMWAIMGSSMHKIWPWVHVVLKWIIQHSSAHVILIGEPGAGEALQAGIIEALEKDDPDADLSRIHAMSGKWNVRQTLAVAKRMSAVVGPETGVLNAVSFERDVAKIVYLSHSSAENLTKHWLNTAVMEPDRAKAPCYPCHRLHPQDYGWAYCHQDEDTAAAVCAASVSPERVFRAIMRGIGVNAQRLVA